MDFKTVLEIILKDFQKDNIRYGLIGGFALGALGLPRASIDLDFLVHRDDLTKIGVIMKRNSYECAYKSENVSQYVSSLKIFGEIDFIHAFREISVKMLNSGDTTLNYEIGGRPEKACLPAGRDNLEDNFDTWRGQRPG